MLAEHIDPGRLSSGELSLGERGHLTSCLQCRTERRRVWPGRLRQLGPYEIVGLLGEGGMARVYAARHRQRGELRAIKVLCGTSPGLLARFLREAQVQQR